MAWQTHHIPHCRSDQRWGPGLELLAGRGIFIGIGDVQAAISVHIPQLTWRSDECCIPG